MGSCPDTDIDPTCVYLGIDTLGEFGEYGRRRIVESNPQ